MKNVNRSRLRSSGTRPVLASQENIGYSSWAAAGSSAAGASASGCWALGDAAAGLAVFFDFFGFGSRHKDTLAAAGLGSSPAAGGLGLLACGRGDRVHARRQLLLQLTVAEELDVGLRVLDRPALDERLR